MRLFDRAMLLQDSILGQYVKKLRRYRQLQLWLRVQGIRPRECGLQVQVFTAELL